MRYKTSLIKVISILQINITIYMAVFKLNNHNHTEEHEIGK